MNRYRDGELPLEYSLILLVAALAFLVWSTLHVWGCRADQKGQFQTNTFNHRFETCDGEHWVPYIVEQPK